MIVEGQGMGLWTRVRLPPIPLKKLSSEAFQKDMKVQKKIPGYRRVSFLLYRKFRGISYRAKMLRKDAHAFAVE